MARDNSPTSEIFHKLKEQSVDMTNILSSFRESTKLSDLPSQRVVNDSCSFLSLRMPYRTEQSRSKSYVGKSAENDQSNSISQIESGQNSFVNRNQ